ncbi:putative Tic20 family protein [Lysinibacillus parviboronicapiens]|uniref:Tic20 family protein n=1 Tax=Lysinibacillus parviboronicapiens TaxID=436516 RepID=A0ABV2PFH5_9BACI
MKKESLLNRGLASLMHLFSLLLTFVLPILVYLVSKDRNKYFADHAKEGMNLHFTFFPVFLLLTLISTKWSAASVLSFALIILETIFIIIAAIYTLKGKKFSYPVIRYFKV